jgi:hypothetical protein
MPEAFVILTSFLGLTLFNFTAMDHRNGVIHLPASKCKFLTNEGNSQLSSNLPNYLIYLIYLISIIYDKYSIIFDKLTSTQRAVTRK